MSNLPNNRLSFSAHDAQQLGVEAAVVLGLITDAARFSNTVELSEQQLQQCLPFMPVTVIDQSFVRLIQAGRVENLGGPIAETGILRCRLSNIRAQMAQPAALAAAPRQTRSSATGQITESWRPNASTMAQLRAQGISDGFAHTQIMPFIAYWQETGQPARAWGPKFVNWVTAEFRKQQARPTASASQVSDQPDTLANNWQPDPEAITILLRAGISQTFINAQLPEFKLYWREKGAASQNWNSLFLQHVKKQAANTATGRDGIPRPIKQGWQPSPEAYEVLAMAQIPQDFAAQEITKFVMFWRDSGEAKKSWNTQFINWVKRSFNSRNQHETNGHANETDTRQRSIVKSLTDTSWADGIELEG